MKNQFKSIFFEPIDDESNFEIDLYKVLDTFKDFNEKKVFLTIRVQENGQYKQKNIDVLNNHIKIYNLEKISEGINTIYPYITKNGFLHLTMTNYSPSKAFFSRRHIENLKFNNHQAQIEGQFSIKNSTIQKTSVVITTRFNEREHEIYLPSINIKKSNNPNISTFKFSIDIYQELIEFMKYSFDSGDVIDIYLKIDVQESFDAIKVKLGNPRIFSEYFLKGEIITDFQGGIVSITPYLTMKGRNLSFRVNTYSVDSYLTYINNLKTSTIKQSLKKRDEKVWVIGEKSYKAQDNGYHFFKYMRTHHPNLPVYYIIEKDSNEAKNVLPYGNVIYYKTAEHFNIMLQADYICTTHHPELLYPTNSTLYTKKIRATKVFLQHGVLGTKNLKNINGNQLNDFNVDLFITSSEREKEIVIRDLNFDNSQVKVTGLARFDELFNPSIKTKNQILIIPTWRDWLINRDRLQDSEYLARMNNLLNSEKLKYIANEGNKIIFCLHPNMQPFIDLFDVPSHIISIKQGDINVQRLIQESKLMITDYSSVAFDFSFLNKPVLYYQFDKNRFLGKEPSHINIEGELPGIIVNNQNDLEDQLKRIINQNYKINEQIKLRAKQFVKYRDQYNSHRIYLSVKNYKKQHQLKNKFKYNILVKHFFKRFRKNKNYYKIMSGYNTAISKLLPVNKDLVVFESNVGKSVSDSPKVIYDVLKKYSNKYKIVWINNKQYPFNDPNVISVKRLSPEYYHYLSRAKFWINNQNFPYYITKPKNTTYIQTWHGTPLKKMLNDIDVFKGRDENYKKRVNHAISYWDYLISPSPYASQCFKSAFAFHKEIIEIGYPRNDIFYTKDEEDIKQKIVNIKQKIGIKDDRKIILYAPTFRDDEVNQAEKHTINLQLDLQRMKENFGNEYIIILRPHIIISNALKLDESLEGFVINGNNYDDISDLYLITDICITDYSSVMFDFANTKKPLLFFTYDLEHYKNQLRGFYFDFESEAPGPLIKTNEELIESIKNINTLQNKYQKKYNQFYNRFCTFETGKAAEHIVKRFF